MKKLFPLTLLVILSAFNASVRAQDTIREGIIKVNYEESNEIKRADTPYVSTGDEVFYIKNDDKRIESHGNNISLRNDKTGDYYNYINNGEKVVYKLPKIDVKETRDSSHYDKPEVKMTDETKTIAGYKCKKLIVTKMFNGEKKPFDYWVTKDIVVAAMTGDNWEGYGFVMEWDMIVYGIKGNDGYLVHKTYKSIKKCKVSDSLFKIPEGYKVEAIGEKPKH